MGPKTKQFTAQTPQMAINAAKDELGDEFSIVSQKRLKDGSHELWVAYDEEEVERAKKAKEEAAARDNSFIAKNNNIAERLELIAQKEMERRKIAQNSAKLPDDVSLQLSDAVREISRLANVPTAQPLRTKSIGDGFELSDLGANSSANSAALNFANANKNATSTLNPSSNSALNPALAPLKSPYSSADGNLRDLDSIQNSSRSLNTKDSNDFRARSSHDEISPKSGDVGELRELRSELNRINDKIKLIQNMFWEEKGPQSSGLMIPHEFAEIYRIARNSGLANEHLEKIMQLTLELMPIKMRENSVLVKRYFREVLRKMIFCRNENATARSIMMFVGPTGVGKTTTIAKLGARASQSSHKNKVGIITLDTYRIGAAEQMAFYAKRMKASFDTVRDIPEFLRALDSMKFCDCVLIDTVGSSQHDMAKLETLKSFVNAEPNIKIDVNLVMSATTKYEDLRDIFSTFSTLGIDTLVFTKLDETRAYGNIFSLAYETKKPTSYFSIGQIVPDDIRAASSDFLVDCLLDGLVK